jgi:hypothetical protein
MIKALSVPQSELMVRTACSWKNARKHAQMQARALDATNQDIIRG